MNDVLTQIPEIGNRRNKVSAARPPQTGKQAQPPKLTVSAIAGTAPDTWEIKSRGQEARTLVALVEAGTAGVTAQELSSWALRLSAYCFFLGKKHGLVIECVREDHAGGWHGRHILRTPVRLTESNDPAVLAREVA